MINPFKEINWKPGPAELRKFGWSLVIGFPCIAILFFLLTWAKTRALPDAHGFLLLGGIGALAGVVCLIIPVIARPLYVIWYALAACIGIVMANLIFTFVFFCIFTPMALFMRLRKRDALRLRWNRSATTHWLDAPAAPRSEEYFRQF